MHADLEYNNMNMPAHQKPVNADSPTDAKAFSKPKYEATSLVSFNKSFSGTSGNETNLKS